MIQRMPISVARLLQRFEQLDVYNREAVYASVISLLDYGKPEADVLEVLTDVLKLARRNPDHAERFAEKAFAPYWDDE